ncbi:hypothetical protein [Vibrio sp. Hal054]|uniref:hypothetical protein n=1 Tax=Vibrio sp. Hal054 TaxID=3035158 RepID=UPI00301E056E
MGLLPSFNAITNIISDTTQNSSFSHCNLMCVSAIDSNVLLSMDGSVFSAFEVIGTQRYLTDETEQYYVDELADGLQSTLRDPRHKMGFMFVRDMNRNEKELDSMFKGTLDTIKRLGIDAEHFFEHQKQDLKENCAFERALLILKTMPQSFVSTETKKDTTVIIDEVPLHTQNVTKESVNLINEHTAFTTSLTSALKKFVGIIPVDADTYLKYTKEEESLISLDHSRWKTKGLLDPVDLTLNDNEPEFVSHPPLAYQLISDDKELVSRFTPYISCGDNFVATIDREYFHITNDCTWSQFFKSLDYKIPIRAYFELETGTDNLVSRLSARKTFLLFFMISEYGRNIDGAINHLMHLATKEGKTLLSGTLSIATWSDNLETLKKNKQALKQALLSWGALTPRTPADPFRGYYSTLPAFSKKPSARPCIQEARQHIATMPFTRPSSPMKSGAICWSSLDGKLVPFNPASPEQSYAANIISGAMDAGKTVMASIINNAYVFAEGNEDLPLMSYLDFGSGVHNYLNSLRAWLPKHQQYKIECIALKNEEGNGFNIFEPQFGLNVLEYREKEFAVGFLKLLLNGESKESLSRQLANTLNLLVAAFFAAFHKTPLRYEARLGSYVKDEHRLHREINKAIEDGTISIASDDHFSWYNVRDQLFLAGKDEWFEHARFAHRQGSPDLTDFYKFICQDNDQRERLESITIDTAAGNVMLYDYIQSALTGIIARYKHILGEKSQIDVSQAKIVGVDLKAIAGGSSSESVFQKQLFGLLAKHLGTRNFWRDPETFLNYVPEMYKDHYRAILASEKNIRKHDFTDEYKQFKSEEMDNYVDNILLIARKYSVAMTLAMQQLSHAPENFLELATNVIVLATTDQDRKLLKDKFTLSDSFLNECRRFLNISEGFGRIFLYLGKFKTHQGMVAQLLRNQVTPSYLWNFASGESDEIVKKLARTRFGEKSAFMRLAKMFPKASVADHISNRINMTQYDEKPLTQNDVIAEVLENLKYV